MNYGITTKHVMRYYAPYISRRGDVCRKGFGSKLSAARFMAKQVLFDRVFGPIEDQGGGDFVWFFRNTPSDKSERAALFAREFPLEECLGCWIDRYGDEHDCSFDCETKGYASCQVNKFLKETTQQFLSGERVFEVPE